MKPLSTFTYNALVISDLHLGEDLSPSATPATRQHLETVEGQLVAFLRHYARRRQDGRPWRLIINGDMVDFLAVCVIPDGDEEGVSPEDREFGLRRTPAVAAAKMAAVLERHQEVFRAMARFLGRGNRVEIISGNHDTEFQWPVTQNVFNEGLKRAWASLPESSREGTDSGAELVERVAFHPWFFYEEGVMWIEHGHQYDECCSFEHQLSPRRPGTDELVMNVDFAGVRYVTNYVHDADPHQTEAWSFPGYIRFGLSLGLRGCARLLKGYYLFTASLISAWRSMAPRSPEAREVAAEHATRLEALAERWQVGAEKLSSLNDLRRRPVVGHLRRLAAVLMLDKLVIYLTAIAIAAVCFTVFGLPWGGVAAAGSVIGARLISMWTSRHRIIDATVGLRITSERILKHVDAKFVVFGHTHEPVDQRLESGAHYYNTGTWMPTGKPGLTRAFTHLVLRHLETGPEMCLRQWRDGKSRRFTAAPENLEAAPEQNLLAPATSPTADVEETAAA